MHNLSNSIYAYYFSHLDALPIEKQFHFGSRLYLWDQDTASRNLLDKLRPWFTQHEQPYATIQAAIAAARNPLFMSANVRELREPYFARYPQLKEYNAALFRILFLRTVYGIQAEDVFVECFNARKVRADYEALLQDVSAISILSTHAINFLYLYRNLVDQTLQPISAEQLLHIGTHAYDLQDPLQLQLLIYLYTHAIIGETLFYCRAVPVGARAVCMQLLGGTEQVISDHFERINLDNKFEFLTCCRIMGHTSPIERRIISEAERSISSEGQFLIDRHNDNPRHDSADFDRSEHRNVLFLMANRKFTPLELVALDNA